ncbi:hypothetical protein IAT38_001688 [Cryptococcus sp. DSM 104549]
MRTSFTTLFGLISCVGVVCGRVSSTPIVDQRALPSTTATTDHSDFTLSTSFEITDVPTTREYTWTLGKATASPDGYEREVYSINGVFPAPLIEANTGDTIIVHVTNDLDEGQSIHWHGMYQNGTVHMDGVPGITQCPIPAGSSFTYNFTVTGQYGTYWYHSHYSNSMADGLWGPLVIHSLDEPLQRGRDYDVDQLVLVTDWMHDESDVIVAALRTSDGYRGSGAPPQGDAVLINGVGQNCSNTADDSICSNPAPPEIQLPINSTVRLRIISTASHNFLRVSLDSHPFEVVEVDATPVNSVSLHEVSVAPGERFSVLINTTEGAEGDAFWLRANTALSCLGGGFTQTALAVPETSAWNDLGGDRDACVGMDEQYSFTPSISKAAPIAAYQTSILDSKRGTFTDVYGESFAGFGFNGISYQNQIYNPLLSIVQEGGSCNASLVASVTFSEIGQGTIIINNLDNGISHPYHLHGSEFQLIGRGTGSVTADEFDALSADALVLDNPIRKDTLWIQGGSWAALRIVTDNPGVWAVHCHIGWHLAEGKLAAVVVQPEAIASSARPSDWIALCNGTDSSHIGPARRRRALPAPPALASPEAPAAPTLVRESLRDVRYRAIQRRGTSRR